MASRTPYADLVEDIQVSDRLADYADAATIARAIERLEKIWRDMGRQMRASKEADERAELHRRRRLINYALKIVRDGMVPMFRLDEKDGVPGDILEQFETAWRRAREVAIEQRTREIEVTPVDDAAWARELARRTRTELSRGECTILSDVSDARH